ncbi:Ubiquitin carboxyl-terminal hydrolase 2 [Erysiphe neolycopersici]|uniref:ubiquitinyl hydrolase 1 n=1 Tax=Erysiphe neolycopersici TaxID=212602 RepID=A0A420HHK5_9PEZI|nr:Ubiquitin carboxyl-terminal hydrolase 2 [Erysiphe neolycopersici]
MANALIAGKTPPRLIADLLDYVPKEVNNGFNLLADPAQQFRNNPLIRRAQNDCRHNLFLRKDCQTQTPVSDDERLESPYHSFVSAICSSCRHHFKITVALDSGDRDDVCNLSQSNYPLHHLILTHSFRGRENIKSSHEPKYEVPYESYEFRCSRINCPFVVKIKILPPRLGKNLLRLIDDPEILAERGNREMKNDPLRFSDLRPVDPYKALKHLASYLIDALNTSREPKKIAARNKKFLLSFSNDCTDLFEYLDFTITQDQTEEDELEFFWSLPKITDQNRSFIQDVLDELTYRAHEKQFRPRDTSQLAFAVPAINQIKIILGYANYVKRKTHFDAETEEHPYYASLGAVEDFTDELLAWAYDRQCECDPCNKPYYLDCLEGLARGRNSYHLQTKVAMATSTGDYGTNAIEEAYNYFELSSSSKDSDEYIISLYEARISLLPGQKEMAQCCLKKIAKHRNSSTLDALANDQTMSYDEALKYLGVNLETAPEFIEASAVVMLVDGDKSKVALALQTIAKEKPGNMVLQRAAAIMASELGQTTLSINDAYKRLQISSHDISDESVLNYFQSLSNGAAPGSKDSFIEALRVIAIDRNSHFLLAKLEDPNAEVLPCKAEPIGLDNIGNTCYLNSLLQYYYSVKPLREMVMDFDKYRMVLNDENLRRKKVGGRQVEKAEVIKAQKFIEELQKLFISLKTAPTRSVRPTKELAALTIFSTQAAEQAVRNNSVDGTKCLQNNDQVPKELESSIQWSSPPSVDENDVEMIENVNMEITGRDEISSDTTLVDTAISSNNSCEVENDTVLILQQSIDVKDQAKTKMSDFEYDAVIVDSNSEQLKNKPSVPDRSSPAPPNDVAGVSGPKQNPLQPDSSNRLWDFGTQQDVTEVIGNVLFRLQCAITAIDYEIASGEQIDIIRESFFGANTVYTQKAHSLQKKVEAWSYLLVFPNPSENVPRSIYEALDVSFDEQMVEIDKQLVPQFTSISKLPRIMQFHIQRTAFDQESLRSWKNRSPVTIPETLYLDRYIDDSDTVNSNIMSRRRETWLWKKQLSRLEARYKVLTQTKEMAIPDALMVTREWINEVNKDPIDGILIDTDLSRLLDIRIDELAVEIDEIKNSIGALKERLQNQFINMRDHEYTLHAVFIHQGEIGGGHYWVYIYDAVNDIWRQYNDETVSEVRNRDYIFKHESVGGGSPYYVVYVQSSIQKELVDPVCRDVQQLETMGMDNSSSNYNSADNFMTNGVGEVNGVRHIEFAGQAIDYNNISATGPDGQW